MLDSAGPVSGEEVWLGAAHRDGSQVLASELLISGGYMSQCQGLRDSLKKPTDSALVCSPGLPHHHFLKPKIP